MKTVVFFNCTSGVGKTSLVYHLAWMFAEKGHNILAADLDPQSNLSSMFLVEERLKELWPKGEHEQTIYGAISPLLKGIGDIEESHIENIFMDKVILPGNLDLIVGDFSLSNYENELSEQWPKCLDRRENSFRVISAFYRIIERAALARNSDYVLIDVGPNLGAINRSAIIAADYVVIPLSPDLYSLQGIRNLGPTLRNWREHWKERLQKNPESSLSLPAGGMRPLGYVILQHAARQDRPVKAYEKWIDRIPGEYRSSVLNEAEENPPQAADDPHCLSLIKHYRSLMPMAMEARKPMFKLKPADGAIGAHVNAVRQCYEDFEHLAEEIEKRIGLKSDA
ncbi:MAG: AAA family ATPase [Candidatus Omnitrophota bacterium]